ncbi:MAG: hypothetical protein ACR2G6_15325 [Gemmatimonadaceae bacterium]
MRDALENAQLAFSHERKLGYQEITLISHTRPLIVTAATAHDDAGRPVDIRVYR